MYQHIISHQVHKKSRLSEFKMFSTKINNGRTIDELDGDPTVSRRFFAPDARSAGGASLRRQTTTTAGWGGFGPRYQEKRTRRLPLGGYVLVDYSSSGKAATPAAAAVSNIVNYKTPRRVDSARLSAARRKKGSQKHFGRLCPTRNAAHPGRLFAASDHNNSNWSRRFVASVREQQ